MSRFFFNDRKQLVNDALEGIVLTSPYGNLVKLEVDPAIRIIARADWDKSRVAVISGGGSGHEPAHAGFVGKGILTAAVCGDLFASPSVDAVLNAIVAVTGDRGCLLIVKNYTGDRLNFGLAAEKAKRYGLKVEMVIVADDIALPDIKQPRGIAGTVLVHKIAGYAAEQGKSLNEVRDIARSVCDNLFSLGVAIQSCHLPGGNEEERIKPGHAELGLGIHGEPGAFVVDSHNSKTLIDTLIAPLKQKVGDAKVAVLINNLGGVSALEMALLTREIAHSSLREQIRWLIGPATLVSSLDMKGFSLTLLKMESGFDAAIQAESETSGWQKPVAFAPAKKRKHRRLHDGIDIAPSENLQTKALLTAATQTLLSLEKRLNALDARVGDGDTGSTFAQGARAVADALAAGELPLNRPAHLLQVIGERLSTVMGGSSGVLMSIFFTAAGQSFQYDRTLPEALLIGLQQMKQYGGADQGDRTLIDALQPALEALQEQGLEAAATAAMQGAQSTAKMLIARAGRASYVNKENLAGVIDPGALAVAEVFAALSPH